MQGAPWNAIAVLEMKKRELVVRRRGVPEEGKKDLREYLIEAFVELTCHMEGENTL